MERIGPFPLLVRPGFYGPPWWFCEIGDAWDWQELGLPSHFDESQVARERDEVRIVCKGTKVLQKLLLCEVSL